ncbi:hypothetical protein FVQ98_09350 [Ottowia sp. GY511]|uniref:DUF4434 domain-containing protein n=1 Tax=Ottowia flava TaxID=2675430 RepID=A0ABW4KXW5_9BURK|nr:hypothetical protein [Ottowia sp. GY511]TXK28504.1 hypothetical protein FVQ98_09350 [Ottowia sp. GY511]
MLRQLRLHALPVMLALVVPFGVRSAVLSVCPLKGATDEPNRRTQLLAESPMQNWALNLHDGAQQPGETACASLQLPVDASAVQWSTLLASDDPLLTAHTLTLQGTARGAAFDVSEVFTSGDEPPEPADSSSAPSTGPVPAWQAFGREERARVQSDGRLVCAAGQAPAGFFARLPPASSPGGQPVLQVVARGRGQFQIGMSDPDRLARESPLALGTLSANKDWRVHELTPLAPQAEWTAVSIACPNVEAELEVRSLALHAGRQQRAAWMWSPALWQSSPDQIWTWVTAHRLNTVMITVPVQQERVANADVLQRFLIEATRRNVAVWAVAGDPRDVLPSSHVALRARLAAYRDYNQTAAASARLAGVQLDIEPYLLPGYRLNPRAWRDAYLGTVQAAREELGAAIPLDMVVPVWWGTDRHWGPGWLDALVSSGVSLTVMNYRTNEAALIKGAAPFLDWGTRYRRPVTMALELGPIPDETRRAFARGQGQGELWALALGQHTALILFNRPVEGLKGSAWQYRNSRNFSGTHVTFERKPAQLQQSVEHLLPTWAAWEGFRGIAIHGLDVTPK